VSDATLTTPEHRAALAGALTTWLPQQRWFGGKARDVTGVTVADVLGSDDAAESLLLAFVDVTYGDGGTDRYQLPLVALGEGAGMPAQGQLVAEIAGVPLVDAMGDSAACLALAAMSLRDGAQRTHGGAVVRGEPLAGARGRTFSRVRRLGVEQSNTSVVLDDEVILKVFRRLEPGLNPDVELTRVLTESGFDHVPPQAGALRLDSHGGATYLTVVSTFAGKAREGWALAVAEAEAVRDGSAGAGELTERIGELGRVVAEMHEVLRDRLGDEDATADHVRGWVADMHRQAERVLDLAQRRAPQQTAPLLDARGAIFAELGRLAGVEDPGRLVRTHGDLHLGQVLLDPEHGWQLLDFEGEPARPLSERLHRQTPLRDVAGVVRSFDYAAASAQLDPSPALAAWRDGLRQAFLAGYRTVAESAGLVPPAAWDPLLAAFELDKALYELGYELENRPDWVAIPVMGILRVIAGT
jgi:maltokinase